MASTFYYDHVATLRRSLHMCKLRFQVPALPAYTCLPKLVTLTQSQIVSCLTNKWSEIKSPPSPFSSCLGKKFSKPFPLSPSVTEYHQLKVFEHKYLWQWSFVLYGTSSRNNRVEHVIWSSSEQLTRVSKKTLVEMYVIPCTGQLKCG